MLKNSSIHPSINCKSEYGILKGLIVVPPKFMEIREVINETQSYYEKENIDKKIAEEQHDAFIRILKEEGANVITLKAETELNEQVFTRDIGFTIGDQLFVANMKRDLRKPETTVLEQWLGDQQITYNQLASSPIEGGDVMVDGKKLWIGVSDRTASDAVKELQDLFPDCQVNPVTIREDILHLDCTLNIIDEKTALIYPPGVDMKTYQLLRDSYQLIEITDEEQFRLGTNVLSIGNKKIISLPENKRINEELKQKGFDVIEVPFSEIIKSGGSFRCCSLPLLRE